MTGGLTAVRALADAEFAQQSWFVPTDLAALTTDVVDEEQRRSGVSVEVGLPAEPVVVELWADGARLAISNVIRNALVHGRRDGVAGVRVLVDGPCVVVDDDGPGIPESERARLVRRFERGSGSGGSGLGLAIARQVAVAHGGGVEIAASPSGGARVAIALAGTPMPDAVA